MAEPQPDVDYPVFVTERGGAYDLRIRELLLIVRGPDLQLAYEELLKRKRQIIDWARELGSLDELPLPSLPPMLGVADRPSGLYRHILWRLGDVWRRIF